MNNDGRLERDALEEIKHIKEWKVAGGVKDAGGKIEMLTGETEKKQRGR